MTNSKRCPKCERTLPVESFGWRDAAHTRRQGWCRSCLNRAGRDSAKRALRGSSEHLRNHYETVLTICGRTANPETSHFYDEAPATELSSCPDCTRIDEQACLEADAAQRQPRGPFDPNPYRQTYLATVERLNQEQFI